LGVRRWEELSTGNRLESLYSREAAFLFNNFVFLAILIATLWGTMYPIISELFTGEKVTVGPPFYNRGKRPAVRRAHRSDGRRAADDVVPYQRPAHWHGDSLARVGGAGRRLAF
jgi:hypothetical protein